MGKDCMGCKNKCGTSKGGIKSFSYMIKEVNSREYLDVDSDESSGYDPIYFLHGNRKMALRFATREEARQVLNQVLMTGMEIDVRHIQNDVGGIQFKIVKMVKK